MTKRTWIRDDTNETISVEMSQVDGSWRYEIPMPFGPHVHVCDSGECVEVDEIATLLLGVERLLP